MTIDRSADGYEPRFDIDAEVGRQGEIFIENVIDAVQRASVEVKTDVMALRTGNFYVEYACRRQGEWKPSGIATTSAELYAFVIGASAWVVPTNLLKELARECWRAGRVKECPRGSHPTKGVTVPISWMVQQMKEAA